MQVAQVMKQSHKVYCIFPRWVMPVLSCSIGYSTPMKDVSATCPVRPCWSYCMCDSKYSGGVQEAADGGQSSSPEAILLTGSQCKESEAGHRSLSHKLPDV